VSDAILIFSVPDLDALAHLIDRLANGQISADLLPSILKLVRSAGSNMQELESLVQFINAVENHGVSTAAAALIREAAASLLLNGRASYRRVNN